MKKKMQKGFTLMELMIVVGIIGVVAAIAIPQFNEYRAQASDATAKSDARSILYMFMMGSYGAQ